MSQQEVVKVQPGELELIQAKSAAQFALTPIGQQVKQFEVQQRMAKMYASSTIVPDTYRDNLGNCVIAIDMANRMNAGVLMVMQNLVIVKGTPTWSSKFLIATINASGRFSPLRYVMVGKPGDDSWGCKVVAYEVDDKEHKNPLEGTTITIGMAKAEGWYQKSGSKWQTMPEQMLKYRAAAFWQRIYAPEIGMGFYTTEEWNDVDDQTQPVYQNVRAEVESKANKDVIGIVEQPVEEVTADKDDKEKDNPKPVQPEAGHEAPIQPTDEVPDFMK